MEGFSLTHYSVARMQTKTPAIHYFLCQLETLGNYNGVNVLTLLHLIIARRGFFLDSDNHKHFHKFIPHPTAFLISTHFPSNERISRGISLDFRWKRYI